MEIKNNVMGMAEQIDALEQEIKAITRMDPLDPRVPLLQERLNRTIHRLYRSVPRGV